MQISFCIHNIGGRVSLIWVREGVVEGDDGVRADVDIEIVGKGGIKFLDSAFEAALIGCVEDVAPESRRVSGVGEVVVSFRNIFN